MMISGRDLFHFYLSICAVFILINLLNDSITVGSLKPFVACPVVHINECKRGLRFKLDIISERAIISHRYVGNHNRANSKFVLSMAKHAFNPFANRNRNTNVKWYEAELESFYTFVQNQPLLSAEQELQYGKALQMWSQVEQMREKIERQNNSTEKLSNEELAKIISCSVLTLDKMSRYAKISKSRLVNSNLKLVLAIVSRYRSSSIPNSELIAEGTRGLSKAVLRFDHSKGVSNCLPLLLRPFPYDVACGALAPFLYLSFASRRTRRGMCIKLSMNTCDGGSTRRRCPVGTCSCIAA